MHVLHSLAVLSFLILLAPICVSAQRQVWVPDDVEPYSVYMTERGQVNGERSLAADR